jgi:hypothetical protein
MGTDGKSSVVTYPERIYFLIVFSSDAFIKNMFYTLTRKSIRKLNSFI